MRPSITSRPPRQSRMATASPEMKYIEGQSSEWVLNHVRAGQEEFTREIVAAGFRVVDEPAILKENYCVRFERVEPAGKGTALGGN